MHYAGSFVPQARRNATREVNVKTQVAIIGAGPAGLLLGHKLKLEGIDCVVLERQTRDYVLSRIRAGLLETFTVDFVKSLGLGDRMIAEGIPDSGINFADGERMIRIDFEALTGKKMFFYGQTELTKDLMVGADERGLHVIYEAADVALHDVESDAPFVTFKQNGEDVRLDAQFIAGCDGFHGPSRRVIPNAASYEFERAYPFGWLGILSDVPPCSFENIYSNHENGFALATLRSHTRSRYYIQVPLEDSIEDWSDERFWDELEVRLGKLPSRPIVRGPALEKSIAPLRSYVFEKMRHGRLFLAGDSAHIVPPTGAKGLNLAASDVMYLSNALVRYFKANDADAIAAYEEKALNRIWKAERFSWQLTNLLHQFPENGRFERRMQVAELEYIAESVAMQTTISENYVGLDL